MNTFWSYVIILLIGLAGGLVLFGIASLLVFIVDRAFKGIRALSKLSRRGKEEQSWLPEEEHQREQEVAEASEEAAAEVPPHEDAPSLIIPANVDPEPIVGRTFDEVLNLNDEPEAETTTTAEQPRKESVLDLTPAASEVAPEPVAETEAADEAPVVVNIEASQPQPAPAVEPAAEPEPVAEPVALPAPKREQPRFPLRKQARAPFPVAKVEPSPKPEAPAEDPLAELKRKLAGN